MASKTPIAGRKEEKKIKMRGQSKVDKNRHELQKNNGRKLKRRRKTHSM